jgi:hypothetical protein
VPAGTVNSSPCVGPVRAISPSREDSDRIRPGGPRGRTRHGAATTSLTARSPVTNTVRHSGNTDGPRERRPRGQPIERSAGSGCRNGPSGRVRFDPWQQGESHGAVKGRARGRWFWTRWVSGVEGGAHLCDLPWCARLARHLYSHLAPVPSRGSDPARSPAGDSERTRCSSVSPRQYAPKPQCPRR